VVQRLQESERAALRAEQMAAVGQLAAGLAHELRNPLAGMEVLAGLLKRRLGDRPEELSLVEELLEELHAAATIVDGPLDFVRPVAPAREPVDWPELVEGALRRARARVRFAGRVERRYEPDLPPAHADPEQMRALLTNLIANALEAMSGGSDPRVHRLSLVLASAAAEDPVRALRVRETETLPAGGGAHPAGRELLVAIGDTGPGVPDELAERIFFPFFTTKDEGSGLGLATAQKLALAHGGSLSLERTPGGGALFQLRLPVAGGKS
jgi:signal transduction histidine kinase